MSAPGRHWGDHRGAPSDAVSTCPPGQPQGGPAGAQPEAAPLRATVIVFAKAPVAGLAKTRLAPALGAAGAAALAARMLQHTLAQAVAAGLGPVELCAAPDARHPLLRAAAAACGAGLAGQGPGDLGQRMHRALARHLAQAPAALLVGTDAPALDAARLRQAAQALQDVDAVFVPALDGGYALVGLRQAQPCCFDGMAWSHPRVMDDTRARLRAAGLRWAELAPVADIDEPADLVHLPAAWHAGLGGLDGLDGLDGLAGQDGPGLPGAGA